MFVFRKIWRALFSRNTRFEIRPFALLSTIWKTKPHYMAFYMQHFNKQYQAEIWFEITAI